MIDLHSHVLPGIDDGTRDLDEAVELGRLAASCGTRVLAATPHLRADHPRVRPSELLGRCEELNERLAQANVALEVVPGGELDLDWIRAASHQDLQLVSYGQRGTDLLVETPYGPLPDDFKEVLADLRERGYRLLVAHPERNPTFREGPGRVAELAEEGIRFQLTARTLIAGVDSPETQRFCEGLIEAGVAHVLASDAHHPHGADPDLGRAVSGARERLGQRVEWMATDAPAAILGGEAL